MAISRSVSPSSPRAVPKQPQPKPESESASVARQAEEPEAHAETRPPTPTIDDVYALIRMIAESDLAEPDSDSYRAVLGELNAMVGQLHDAPAAVRSSGLKTLQRAIEQMDTSVFAQSVMPTILRAMPGAVLEASPPASAASAPGAVVMHLRSTQPPGGASIGIAPPGGPVVAFGDALANDAEDASVPAQSAPAKTGLAISAFSLALDATRRRFNQFFAAVVNNPAALDVRATLATCDGFAQSLADSLADSKAEARTPADRENVLAAREEFVQKMLSTHQSLVKRPIVVKAIAQVIQSVLRNRPDLAEIAKRQMQVPRLVGQEGKTEASAAHRAGMVQRPAHKGVGPAHPSTREEIEQVLSASGQKELGIGVELLNGIDDIAAVAGRGDLDRVPDLIDEIAERIVKTGLINNSLIVTRLVTTVRQLQAQHPDHHQLYEEAILRNFDRPSAGQHRYYICRDGKALPSYNKEPD